MSNKKNAMATGTVHLRNNSVDTERKKQCGLVLQNGFRDTEDVFRGFEKVPKVLINPVDVTPYFNKSNLSIKMNSNGFGVHFEKLSKKCIVRVRRDDLLELKRIYQNGKNSSCIFSGQNIKCKICDKVYSSEKKLQNHLDNKHTLVAIPNKKVQKRVSFSDHVIVHEVKEYHSCRKCTKIFENYKSLKTHMKLKHKKRKCYICYYCSKDFVDRMFFKVHIKLHCDRCGLLFPTRQLHLEHKRTVCKQQKQYKCKTCNETYFYFMDLKDHSYEHLGTFFICDICKDQFQTKCGVAHHISFSHTNMRPSSLHSAIDDGTDKLYRCNFCNKASSDKTKIESHTGTLPDLSDRIMTGYKDHNFCDLCLTKFSTEKEMLQHKWSHFLKTETKAKKDKKLTFKMDEIPKHFLKAQVLLKKLELPKPSNQNGQFTSQSCKDNQNDTSMLQKCLEASDRVNDKPTWGGFTEKPASGALIDKRALGGFLETSTLGRLIENTALDRLIEKPASGGLIGIPASGGFIEKPPSAGFIEISASGEIIKKPASSEFIEKSASDGMNEKPKNKPRKVLFSPHQCQNCSKYYSTAYCLRRHIKTQHSDFNDLQCKVCEEIFVWPSLLMNHKCIRLRHPEMPFDDARPEIQIENLYDAPQNGSDDFGFPDDETSAVDFEIPAPIVSMTESDTPYVPPGILSPQNFNTNTVYVAPNHNSPYTLVMQEVPIEF